MIRLEVRIESNEDGISVLGSSDGFADAPLGEKKVAAMFDVAIGATIQFVADRMKNGVRIETRKDVKGPIESALRRHGCVQTLKDLGAL